jgi:phospholipid transport system substrate-binding protein
MVHLFAATVSVLALTFGAAGAAFAGPATDVVKAKQSTLFELIGKPTPDDKKIAAIFDEMLDYGALAEGSLGSEWAARSPEEKAQFSDLLKQLVRKAYERNLKKIVNFDLEYLGEDAADGGILVKTKAKPKSADQREEPVEIGFKMAQKGGTWKAVDIVTEGVSLVTSYRSQFTKVIKKDGFPVLIQKMKDKLAKGDV